VNPDTVNSLDPGLGALVMLLRLHGVGADAEQLRHQLGTDRVGVPEMLRCAKALGLKARATNSSWERLASTPLPARALSPAEDVGAQGGFIASLFAIAA
jgi:subfamily B ATP-binding cassette protein HlyB/CyaB